MSLLSKWRALCCVLVLHAAAAEASTPVPAVFRALLEEHGIPEAHVGLYVESFDGEIVASLNADEPYNPASVVKLLPSLAALEMLSPSYRWSTDVYADADPVDGVLPGDLYIRGGGDPYLTVESVWALLKSVHARGIERISGNIVVDDGVFDVPAFDRGAFDGKPYRIYNGPPGGLMMNFWAVRFTISAGGKSVYIDAFPDSGRLEIINHVKDSDAPCDRRHRYVAYRVAEKPASIKVTFNGVLSRRCRPIVLTRAVIPADRYLSYVLPGLWRDAGGVLDGEVRNGAVPAGARRLYSHPSRSLGEVVQATNKYSNNMMARHLLITLGKLYKDEDIDVSDGRRALEDWLLSAGIDVPGLRLVNGSGLSRDARISARGMVNVLRAGYVSRYAPEFLAALPIAGQDRAMEGRDYPGGNGAMVRLKTGLIDHVRAMAACITTAAGETYFAVLLVNHRGAHRGIGTLLQDALIRYVLVRNHD